MSRNSTDSSPVPSDQSNKEPEIYIEGEDEKGETSQHYDAQNNFPLV